MRVKTPYVELLEYVTQTGRTWVKPKKLHQLFRDDVFTEAAVDVLIREGFLRRKKDKVGLNWDNPALLDIWTYARKSHKKHEVPQMLISFFNTPNGPVAAIRDDLPQSPPEQVEAPPPVEPIPEPAEHDEEPEPEEEAPEEPIEVAMHELPEAPEPSFAAPEPIPEPSFAPPKPGIRERIVLPKFSLRDYMRKRDKQKEAALMQEINEVLHIPNEDLEPEPLPEASALEQLNDEFLMFRVKSLPPEKRREEAIYLIRKFSQLNELTIRGVKFSGTLELQHTLERFKDPELYSVLRQIMSFTEDELARQSGGSFRRFVGSLFKRPKGL